jgi:hypothetical protein
LKRPNSGSSVCEPIFVLGMHRSGTSAVAGVLARLGFSLGTELVPAQSRVNDAGFFEDKAVLEFHESLLAALGRAWDHPSRSTRCSLFARTARVFTSSAPVLAMRSISGGS